MILASRAPSQWIQGGNRHAAVEFANDESSSPIDQVFYLLLFASASVVASLRGVKWGRLFSANTAILLLYLYFAASVMWSSDPSGSLKRIAKDFGLFFVIGVIFTEINPLEAMRSVYVRSAALLLPLSFVFIKYFPNWGRSYSVEGGMLFTGVTTQKNSLGEIVLVFTMFIIWDYLETHPAGSKLRLSRVPWDLLILLLTSMWLLNLSQSKTALLCTLVGAFLIVRSGRLMSKPINRVALAGALSLPVLLFFSQQFSEVIAPLIQALGRNMTFTGRTDIWEHITLKTVNPLIGAGYWNFWGGPGGYKINEAMNCIIPNAHNGYMDLYLDGGVIGLIILFYMLCSCGCRIARRIRVGGDQNRYQRVRFAVLIAAIIYNLSESTFVRLGPIWLTTLLMIVEIPSTALAGRERRAAHYRRASTTKSRVVPVCE